MEKNNELCFAPFRELWVLIVLCWLLLAAAIVLAVLLPQTAWRIAMALTACLVKFKTTKHRILWKRKTVC